MKAVSIKRPVLIAVIAILACLAFGPSGQLGRTSAQGGRVEYLVVASPRERVAKQAVLEKYGQQGWRLAALDFAHEESFIFMR